MFTRVSKLTVWALLAICATAAGDEGAPSVSVQGEASKLYRPEAARVRFRVFAHGSKSASALAKLSRAQEELRRRIDALTDPKPEALIAEAVERSGDKPNFQQQMMINMGMGKTPTRDSEKKLILMTFDVTLTWKLDGATLTEQYKALDDVRRKVEELRLLKAEDDDVEIDEEDGDDDEEVKVKDHDAAPQGGASDDLKVQDGPVFDFIRQLSEEELSELARAAFENARIKAGRLAAASGGTLGALTSLSNIGGETLVSQLGSYQEQMMAVFGEEGGVNSFVDPDSAAVEGELSTDRLKPIPYKVALTAHFEVQGN